MTFSFTCVILVLIALINYYVICPALHYSEAETGGAFIQPMKYIEVIFYVWRM